MSVSPVTRSHLGRRPRLLAALAAAAILAVGVTTLACALAGLGGTQARAAAPSVEARSGILIDTMSGKVLWSKSPDLRLAPASCTKIMTALLVLERYRDLDRYVRVPSAATQQQGVAVGLRTGDRITVQQALRALMVRAPTTLRSRLRTPWGAASQASSG